MLAVFTLTFRGHDSLSTLQRQAGEKAFPVSTRREQKE